VRLDHLLLSMTSFIRQAPAQDTCMSTLNSHGAVAQLGEHLLCKQGVVGSIPISSTRSSRLGEHDRPRIGSVAQVVRAHP